MHLKTSTYLGPRKHSILKLLPGVTNSPSYVKPVGLDLSPKEVIYFRGFAFQKTFLSETVSSGTKKDKSNINVLNLLGYCDQSYKQFTLVIHESGVVLWGIFKSGTTLEL